jgi:hypothetical protein
VRYLSLLLSAFLSVCLFAAPARAANKPNSEAPDKQKTVWTNDEVEKLRLRGLITVFNVPAAPPEAPAAPQPYDRTKDPVWYADEAAKLHAELANAQAEVRQYRKTLDDARDLKRTTGGIALDQGALGITPQAGIEILESRVRDLATKIDALHDMARHNGFPPGLTRG